MPEKKDKTQEQGCRRHCVLGDLNMTQKKKNKTKQTNYLPL
jgi:hypothetical protein